VDKLWPTFQNLWRDIERVLPGKMLLTGGYALYLKQSWLQELGQQASRIAIPFDRWPDQTPRATKDFDLITTLEMLTARADQEAIDAVLKQHIFEPSPGNERWQFRRTAEPGAEITIDFHSPVPTAGRAGLRINARRVQPKPSLNGIGIHGRANQEAEFALHAPFQFEHQGLQVRIPNAAALVTMKLAAVRDRMALAKADRTSFETEQSRKHANDVFRAVAMVTREEADEIGAVLPTIKALGKQMRVSQTLEETIANPRHPIAIWLANQWGTSKFDEIQAIVAGWLKAD
jgi:hypothetical protein